MVMKNEVGLIKKFSCPKGSSIDGELTGGAKGAGAAAAGAAILRKSREVQFRSFSRSGNC